MAIYYIIFMSFRGMEISREERNNLMKVIKAKRTFDIVTVGLYSYFSVQANFWDARMALGLSQREVGERAGLSRSYYGEIERLEARTTVDLTKRIMKVLNIEAEEEKPSVKSKNSGKSVKAPNKKSVQEEKKVSRESFSLKREVSTAPKSSAKESKTKKPVSKSSKSSGKKSQSKSHSGRGDNKIGSSVLLKIRGPPN